MIVVRCRVPGSDRFQSNVEVNHVSWEAITAERVYRHNEFHNQFSKGTAEEIIRMISDAPKRQAK